MALMVNRLISLIGFLFFVVSCSTQLSVEEARQLLDRAEEELFGLSHESGLAAWVNATNITRDTDILAAKANERVINATVELAKQASRFDNIDLPPEMARKMKFAVETGLVQAGKVLVIDLDTCVRCNSCVEACSATHEGYPRIERTGQRLGRLLFPTSCMHCANPECMLCPHGGIDQKE